MNAAAHNISLRHLADKDLARRSQASGLVIFTAVVLRTWLILKFSTMYQPSPDAWLPETR